jgi:hypothetical protein
MTVIQGSLAIQIKFKGVDYLALVSRTYGNDTLTVTSNMLAAEQDPHLLYSKQIDEMLKQVQGYTPEQGDLRAITAEGVQFANNLPSLPGAAHAAGVWERFVATLHEPEFHIQNDRKAPQVIGTNGNAQISLVRDPYLSLQPEQKRAVGSRVYEKLYRESGDEGTQMNYTPEEECLRTYLTDNNHLRVRPARRWERMFLLNAQNSMNSLFLEDEEERAQAKRIADSLVPDPIVEDDDSSEPLASSGATV